MKVENRLKLVAGVVVLYGVTSCAPLPTMSSQTNSCQTVLGRAPAQTYDVAAPGTLPAINKIILSADNIDNLSSTKKLIELLSQPLNGALVVTGIDEERTAAILKAAFDKVAATANHPANTVCFANSLKKNEAIKTAADKAGIKLLMP